MATTITSPGPRSKAKCTTPRCDGWFSGRPGLAGCARCRVRAHKRMRSEPKRGRPTPPRFPCPTPGCDGTYGGRSKFGCLRCQWRHQHTKRKAERRCHRCVKPMPAGHARRMCPGCQPEENRRQRICRAERVEAGKCVSCPARAVSWAVQCKRCLGLRKKSRQRVKAKRLARGRAA